MIISRLENIGTDNLSQNYRTANGVGLCYFDPTEEVLREFEGNSVLPIYPGEVSKRQFYIVKDGHNLVLNTLTFKASVDDTSYEVKTALDYNADFDAITNGNTVIIFFSQYPTGIIPITVYIKNINDTTEELDLNIELEVA